MGSTPVTSSLHVYSNTSSSYTTRFLVEVVHRALHMYEVVSSTETLYR
jgi:hypothetical protein